MLIQSFDKKRKEPQPTPNRASTEALLNIYRVRKQAKIDLYPDIFAWSGLQGKTYGASFSGGLQGKKTLIFNPYHDTVTPLSVRLER